MSCGLVGPPSCPSIHVALCLSSKLASPRRCPAWKDPDGTRPSRPGFRIWGQTVNDNVHPCIIYQRLRPSTPEASGYATEVIWPLVDRVVEQENYTPCGLYGDSEFAPPFCGGYEIRPSFEQALAHASRIAGKLGRCTLLIGNAASLGDGDPFLPGYWQPGLARDVHTRLVNFTLRPQLRSTPLRSAWRYFDQYLRAEQHKAVGETIPVPPVCADIELRLKRMPERLLARIYLANPRLQPLHLQWKQLIRPVDRAPAELRSTDWSSITVPAREAVYLETVLQGELPWVRQVRVKGEICGMRRVGTAHLSPFDMVRDSVPLAWEALG